MMSFSLFFSARWRNYRRIRLSGRDAHLLAFPQDADHDCNPATANDLSYEDAILGLQIRSFMQAEYGSVEPPPGIFRLVIKAIERGIAPSRSRANDTLARRVRFVLNGPVTGRLVPGMVAFALVLLVFGPNATRFLNPSGVAMSLESPAVSPPPVAQQTGSQVTTEPTSEVLTIEGLELPIKDETQFYDRVELRLPAMHHADKADQPDDEQQDDQYERNRNGAQ